MIMAFSTHQVMNTDGGLATAATAVVKEAGGWHALVGSGVRRCEAACGFATLLHGTHGVKPTHSETYIVWTHTSSKTEL